MKRIYFIVIILLCGLLLAAPAGVAKSSTPEPLTDADLSIGGITLGMDIGDTSPLPELTRVGRGWYEGESTWDAIFAKDGKHISYVTTTVPGYVTPRGVGINASAEEVQDVYGEPVARAEQYHHAMYYASESGYLMFFTVPRDEIERVTRIAFIQKSDDMVFLHEDETDIDGDGKMESVRFAVPDIGLNADFSHIAPIRMSVSRDGQQDDADVFVGGVNDNLVISVEASGCFGDTPMLVISGDVHGATGWGYTLYEGYQWKDGKLEQLFSFDQWNEDIADIDPFLTQHKLNNIVYTVYMGRPTAAQWEGREALCVPLWLLTGYYPYHESDDVRLNVYVRYEQGEWRTLGVERRTD